MKVLLTSFFVLFYIIILFFYAVYLRLRLNKKEHNPKLVWGPISIMNNVYWSKAMNSAGFDSCTFTYSYYEIIHKRTDWDHILQEKYNLLPSYLKCYIAFLESLGNYDIFFLPFHGFFLGLTPLWKLEAFFLKLAGKKTVLIPYGADAYTYRRVLSTSLTHGLLMSYPRASHQQNKIAAKVDYWCKHSDAIISTFMGFDGLGRWDVLIPSPICLDLEKWSPSKRLNSVQNCNDTIFVAHAPNHRGFKGTEFITEAIKCLKAEGLNVELLLLEGIQNSEVREFFQHKVDILIEQIVATGHALNALEGMASGLPVICNLEDTSYILPFYRWSYFSECPIVSATPENLVDILRKLITRPTLRHQLGKAGREYVEKYHGLDSAQYLFSNVIDYVYGRKESLINLYHPLLGEYPNRKPRVEHPLVNNKIVD